MSDKAGLFAGFSLALILSSASNTAVAASAHDAHHAGGSADFSVSCSKEARAEFNHAVTLLHHMTYPQAQEKFERVAAIDPQCAMAHWGIAMTLFQPLWPTRPTVEMRQRGWDAVQKAKALKAPTERERLFIAAAEAFYTDPASADYWARIRRWEQAMEKAYAALPNDIEVAAFYALAHLAVVPANVVSRTNADRAGKILLGIYARNADHPGAMHYLVHANDVPGRERERLEITRRYESAAPRNPHALHMPTHIYTRLGDWDGVIRGNLRAAEAALEHRAGDRGQFVWDEFPHAIEYLVYGYLQKGADQEAAAQVKRLRETAALEPSFKTAFHLASTQARYALERRAWAEAAAITPRDAPGLEWDRFAWPEAISHFARGLGAARLGRVADAKASIGRLNELEAVMRKAGEEMFARNIQTLRLGLSAWTAHAEGQREASLALMREAVEIETSTPKHAVTPGPTLPAHELLGDLLMEQKQPAQALAEYRRALELYPHRFNGLLGGARAARASGDQQLARALYQELMTVAGGSTRQEALAEAQNFVAPIGVTR